MTQALSKQSKEDFDQILADRARILARQMQAEAEEGEFLQLLTFPLGEERFAVAVDFVKEVQPLGKHKLSLVPCTPDFIVGAVNIRGRIYSTMHVARFLGIKTPSQPESAYLLLVQGDDDMELCILTDDVPRIEHIPTTSMQPSATTVSVKSQEYVQGVTEDMLTILDLKRLLSDPRIIVQEEG